MNLLVENGIIKEMEYGANFGYVLNQSASFLSTEYKVLQSQTAGSLIKCMKIMLNGQVELFYLTNGYKPFSSMIGQMDPDRFIIAVENLFQGIIDIKNNGFLSCEKIDSSFDHIYFDPSTLKVGLVYLPLNKSEYPDADSFENNLRTSLIRLISSVDSLSSNRTMQLQVDLQNGMLSLNDIVVKLGGRGSGAERTPGKVARTDSYLKSTGAKLVSLNAPTKIEFNLGKPEFLIGKKETNDGVITFNRMVSRVHCKITNVGGQFMIMDLNSANGTYINGSRVQPNLARPLKNGDIIRLANSDFQVVLG